FFSLKAHILMHQKRKDTEGENMRQSGEENHRRRPRFLPDVITVKGQVVQTPVLFYSISAVTLLNERASNE
uniref:Uncharacterized protein n=1 Tax=Sphaeramia orbicularis TaxID=375764 RepID=A0A673BRI8_9TELE